MIEYSRKIARNLLQIKAIQLSPQKPFTWASGIKSPIYCDNRLLLSYPEIRSQVIDAFVELSKDLNFDAISGVATAGIAHGALLAQKLDLPFSYVRSKAKGHGKQNLIEGRIEPNTKVLLIEDLISTGGSSLKAAEALKAQNVEIVATLAIFTYGFDRSLLAFKEAACTLRTITDFDIVMEEALKSGYISGTEIGVLQDWRTNYTK